MAIHGLTVTRRALRISSRSSPSCQLHGLDGEDYLTDVIRVVPFLLYKRHPNKPKIVLPR